MKILRRMAVSFSLYSRIPVPFIHYEKDDMAHSLMWFPLVGAVIGAGVWIVNGPAFMQKIPAAVRVMLTMLVPVYITGGFHLDGFMDTEDALHSYAPRERKLEILKDPHIGAFAVIGFVRMGLLFAAAVTVVVLYPGNRSENILLFASVFMIGRALSGLTSLFFQKAKKDGMLVKETGNRSGSVTRCLIVQLILSAAFCLALDVRKGALMLLAFAGCTAWYRYRTYRVFGGVTGDTAGHFLVSGETVATVALACAVICGM